METNAAAAVWAELKFQNLQHVLDEQSRRINAAKQEGTANRHALTARTKEFRRLDDAGKLGALRTLLKSYQTEIDALTERCKYAESCFMNVYKSLALLPDPAAQMLSQQRELARLSEQAEQRPESDASLAKQLERQIRYSAQLEKRLRDAEGPPSAITEASEQLATRADELELQLSETRSQLARAQADARDAAGSALRQQTELKTALARLAAQQDYDDIKRENKDLRAELVAEDPRPADDDAARSALRKRNGELEERLARVEAERDALQASTQEQQTLVHKLEDDLAKLNASETFTTVSGWTAVTRAQDALPSMLAGPTTGAPGVPSSPLPILSEQRDRYRQRAQELQERSHRAETELETRKKELDTARREIYTLYDRLRHLQHAAGATGATGASTAASAAPASALYTPNPQFLMKELDLERRVAGLTRPEALLVELYARGVVDARFRRLSAMYAAAVHLLLVAGVLL